MRTSNFKTRLAILLVAVSLTGCIHRAGSNQPVTPYEQVMVWNDALAQTNNSIAKGIIQVSPQFVPADKAAVVLRAQSKIAQFDEQLTVILKQGQAAAKINAATVKSLVDQLKASVTSLVNSGAIGVKNPKTQQTFDADIQAINNFIDNIISGLATAGVIQ